MKSLQYLLNITSISLSCIVGINVAYAVTDMSDEEVKKEIVRGSKSVMLMIYGKYSCPCPDSEDANSGSCGDKSLYYQYRSVKGLCFSDQTELFNSDYIASCKIYCFPTDVTDSEIAAYRRHFGIPTVSKPAPPAAPLPPVKAF